MIAGRYEPLEGGRARDVELDRVVRLRWLDDGERPDDPRLLHPNAVRVYDVGEHDGRRFVALEHVQGRPLAEVAPLPADEAVVLGTQCCRALAAAHELGLVHDGEILVRHDGVPKLAGFHPGAPGDDVRALARALNDAAPDLPPLTAANTVALARELERARPPAPTVPLAPLPARRRRSRLPLVLAAVAVLAVVGGVAGVLATAGGDAKKPRVQPVARVAPVPHAASAEQQAQNLAAWLSRYSR